MPVGGEAEVVYRQRVCGTGNDAQCSGVGRDRPGSDTGGASSCCDSSRSDATRTDGRRST